MVMLNAIKLSAIKLSTIMLNVVMLSVVILSVVAPLWSLETADTCDQKKYIGDTTNQDYKTYNICNQYSGALS